MREKIGAARPDRLDSIQLMAEAQSLTEQLVSTYERPESVESTTPADAEAKATDTPKTVRCEGCEKRCEVTPDDKAMLDELFATAMPNVLLASILRRPRAA